MRKYYLDNIRWATVMLVVLYHVIYMFNGEAVAGVVGPFSPVQYQDAVQYILYPWVMPALFLVSGMCARYYLENHTGKEFLRSRTRKLLVPSTLGLLAFQWIQGYVNMRLSNAFAAMGALPGPVLYLIMAVSGIGVLWYIQILWVFSVLLLLVRMVEKGRLYRASERAGLPVLILLGGLVWAAAQVLNTPVITVYRFGLYGSCFFLGYFVFAQEAVTDRLAKAAPALIPAALILMAANLVVHFGENYAVEPVVNSPLAVAYGWIMCLTVLGAMKRWGDKKTPFTAWMSGKSWGLYVFHYLPLSACALLLTERAKLPPVCVYLLTGLSAFLGAYLLNELISRVPVLRWLVLGIGKERKHASGQSDPAAEAP